MTGVNGILIIDKPAGLTSHDVVARVRKITAEKRVGHTGTLDPFATGVLVVLVGRATRLAQFLSGADKEYETVIRLGYATDTGDATGTRLEAANGFTAETQRTQSLRRENIESALAGLRGVIEQMPPMYSAKKIAGRKLYELARRGEEIERQPIRVNISQFEVIRQDGMLLKENDDNTSDLCAKVVCSAGTYVRTLAEDFGRRLGLGAHLRELRRSRAGRFTIKDATTLKRLTEVMDSRSLEQLLISPDAALSHLPSVPLTAADATRVCHGVDVQFDDTATRGWPDARPVRLSTSNGELIAVGIYDRNRNVIHPSVVIANG